MRTNVSTDSPIATLAESTLLPVSVRPLVTPVPNWSSTKSAPTAVTMNGVEWIGLVTVTVLTLKIVYNLVSFFYTAFVGAALGRNIDLSQHGPWAVVTGATDGIGKAYAFKMASVGLNVVLVSRTQEKLLQVAEEIRKQSPSVETKTIAVDFTDGVSIYGRLASELAQLDVGVLINNVGMSNDGPEPYAEHVEQLVPDLINCNIMSMARVTHIVLPAMIRRKKGIIINIGSQSSATSTPLLTLYGATKAFVDKFSRDLTSEVKQHGVVVQTVHPGFVVSKLSKMRRATIVVPSAKDFVEGQLKTLGLESRTSGFWMHKIHLYFMELNDFFAPQLSAYLGLRLMTAIRKKIEKRKRAN